MSKTDIEYLHILTQLNGYANQHNPNYLAHQSNNNNHANQCNPNNSNYQGHQSGKNSNYICF